MLSQMRMGIYLIFMAGFAFTIRAAQPAHALTVSGHRIGQIFRDCRDACPEMVVVPPGHFQMGSVTMTGDTGLKKVLSTRCTSPIRLLPASTL